MRRSRRGSRAVDFPSSGEDSFVAIVVTKLTGALLFILLLTMTIMALLPRAVDTAGPATASDVAAAKLEITTPEALPEAIAGRPYHLALAAIGATEQARWTVVGELPEGLTLDPVSGRIEGTPTRALSGVRELSLIVSDGPRRASSGARLVVYEPDESLVLASPWLPQRPRVAIRSWLQNGFGFVVLLLVHAVGMNAIAGLEGRARGADPESRASVRRFFAYRAVLRVASLSAFLGLTIWLIRPLNH